MTQAEFLDSIKITRLSKYVQTHSAHRICLEYKKLKRPKTTYTVWRIQDGQELGTDIPKIIYDYLKDKEEKSPNL